MSDSELAPGYRTPHTNCQGKKEEGQGSLYQVLHKFFRTPNKAIENLKIKILQVRVSLVEEVRV